MPEDDSQLRLRVTTIAHADHLFLSPLSLSKADWLIDLLDLPSGASVLDVGCGKAAFLRRVLERYPTAAGIGIDINAGFLATAAAEAIGEGVARRLTLQQRPAAEYLETSPRFDALLCSGASHALGGFDGVTAAASRILNRAGVLLLGEGFWRQLPAPDYLSVLGATIEEMTDHAGNVARLRRAGFDVLAAAAASADEWDVYEGLYCRAQIRWARAHPEDPFASEMLVKASRWHDAYLRWGRDTLGFGWYLAVPSGPPPTSET